MGYSFSNIQVRHCGSLEALDSEKLVGFLANNQTLLRTEKEEEADIVISVFKQKNSEWVTVTSDIIDCDIDAQLKCAKDIADGMQTEVMAISCFDSDYLFLNLIDPKRGKDIWASCGSFPYGKAPRRSNLSAWKNYVSDAESFRRVMRSHFTFAENCLNELEPLLNLPSSQSICGVGDEPADADVMRFYYKSTAVAAGRPPKFVLHTGALSYHIHGDPNVFNGNPNLVSFINTGDAFKGAAVCLAGSCISERRIYVKHIELQQHGAHEEYIHMPIALEERVSSDGSVMLYGECRDIRVPASIPDNLPPKKRMDMKFQRSVDVRFYIDAVDPDCPLEELGDLHVSLFPLPNPDGGCKMIIKKAFDEDAMHKEWERLAEKMNL